MANTTSYELFGRRTIFSSTDYIDDNNIIAQVNNALSLHCRNLLEEEYLYWYRRGLQPVLNRTKEVRPDICHKTVENHADEIVAFKNGYFLTQPAFYISRSESDEVTKKVALINEYLYRSGKQQADNELVDWFHTVGKAALFVKPVDDVDILYKAYALDPRSAFVVYSMSPERQPIMGINMVSDNEKLYIDVITNDYVWKLNGTVRGKLMSYNPNYLATAVNIVGKEPNPLGLINIIEYSYNSVNMGAFEAVVPLLNALSEISSNRLDGIDQFIQSLAVAVNCEFPKKENGDDVTANDIRQAGMIVLRSIGENKASFQILSEQLNQTETQTLVDYIYEQVLTICGMPSTTKGGKSTSDTGAAVLARDGWYQADNVARNTEDLFKKSNKYFDEIMLKILNTNLGIDARISDFELQFVRNETANAQSKAQTLATLLSCGVAPELAFAKSGISNDPVQDVALSEKYLKARWNWDAEKGEANYGATTSN